MSLILGNRGTKLNKLEGENMVSKFIKRGTNKEKLWEHGNIGQFWQGTREQGPPLGDPHHCLIGWNSFYIDLQAEESEFQASAPSANLIKMKKHFRFILMNWNITSPKMVRNNILEG